MPARACEQALHAGADVAGRAVGDEALRERADLAAYLFDGRPACPTAARARRR
jgi:hypothetical protein